MSQTTSETGSSRRQTQAGHHMPSLWLQATDWADLDQAALAAGRPHGWLAELRRDPFIEAVIEAAFQIGARRVRLAQGYRP